MINQEFAKDLIGVPALFKRSEGITIVEDKIEKLSPGGKNAYLPLLGWIALTDLELVERLDQEKKEEK